MNHADFEIISLTDDCVFLRDLDLGNKSVTNDAEYVVEEIINEYPNRRIIYQDTMGCWDELMHNGTNFIGFGPYRGDAPV